MSLYNQTPQISSANFTDQLSFRSSGSQTDAYNIWVAPDPKLSFHSFLPENLKNNQVLAIMKKLPHSESNTFITHVPHYEVRGRPENVYFKGSYTVGAVDTLGAYTTLKLYVLSHTNNNSHGSEIPGTNIGDAHFLLKYPETLTFTYVSNDPINLQTGTNYTLRVSPYSKLDWNNLDLSAITISTPVALCRDWDTSKDFIKHSKNYKVTSDISNKVFTGTYTVSKIVQARADSLTYEKHLLIYLHGSK